MFGKYFKTIAFMLAVVVGIVPMLCGCETYDAFAKEFVEPEKAPEETVRFGVFEPLSGKDQKFGELEKIGIELAHELYPTALKKPVELIYADNQSDIYVAETAIRELIEARPAVIFGSYGDVYSLIAADYIEEAKIPTLAITNTNPLITSNNPYYFRVCFVETYQGDMLAKFTVDSLHQQSAAILRRKDNDASVALGKSFEEKMIQLTGDSNAIKLTLEYDENTESFESLILMLKSNDVKVVFLPTGVDDAVKILQEAKKQEYNGTFLGLELWLDDGLIEKVGDAAERVAIATLYDPSTEINEMASTFLSAYKAKYGADAVPPPEVAMGFDAYIIAIDSINRIGTALDGELMAKSIALETNFPGASGNITFDINGDPMKSGVIMGVKDGELISLYTMEPIFE